MLRAVRCTTVRNNFFAATISTSNAGVTTGQIRTLATAHRMSLPAPHLLHVTSCPTQVSAQVWKEWYRSEHLYDFVKSNAAVRAALYEEIDLVGSSSLESQSSFLAVYQTDFKECLKTPNYQDVRSRSTLFENNGAKSDSIWENGDFNARNYELIQTYDPQSIGEGMQIVLNTRSYSECRPIVNPNKDRLPRCSLQKHNLRIPMTMTIGFAPNTSVSLLAFQGTGARYDTSWVRRHRRQRMGTRRCFLQYMRWKMQRGGCKGGLRLQKRLDRVNGR